MYIYIQTIFCMLTIGGFFLWCLLSPVINCHCVILPTPLIMFIQSFEWNHIPLTREGEYFKIIHYILLFIMGSYNISLI